jgi:hypothetical protein
MIEYILTFVNDRDLGRCRQVNRRLYRIAHDPYMVKQFPHIYVDGSLYLKEQAYFTPVIRDWIFTHTASQDIDWLVSRTTPIIREIFNGNMMAWSLMIELYCNRTYNVASNTNSTVANGLTWTVINNVFEETNKINISCHMVWNATREAWHLESNFIRNARHAVEHQCLHDTTSLYCTCIKVVKDALQPSITDPYLTDPYLIGLKCVQISKCMILLCLNKTLLSKIKDITDTHLKGIEFFLADDDFEYLKDDPLIKQYNDLVCNNI